MLRLRLKIISSFSDAAVAAWSVVGWELKSVKRSNVISVTQHNQWISTELWDLEVIYQILFGKHYLSCCCSGTNQPNSKPGTGLKREPDCWISHAGRNITVRVPFHFWSAGNRRNLSIFGHLTSPGCGDNCSRLRGNKQSPNPSSLAGSAKCLLCTWYVGPTL